MSSDVLLEEFEVEFIRKLQIMSYASQTGPGIHLPIRTDEFVLPEPLFGAGLRLIAISGCIEMIGRTVDNSLHRTLAEAHQLVPIRKIPLSLNITVSNISPDGSNIWGINQPFKPVRKLNGKFKRLNCLQTVVNEKGWSLQPEDYDSAGGGEEQLAVLVKTRTERRRKEEVEKERLALEVFYHEDRYIEALGIGTVSIWYGDTKVIHGWNPYVSVPYARMRPYTGSFHCPRQIQPLQPIIGVKLFLAELSTSSGGYRDHYSGCQAQETQ
ncbi:hypothetical protein DFH06DRAFT_1297447 [Mycena polygramma]|nr:hypothetical protein DFH06DRAFT_1297447 [Mycena polygramma]